MSEIKEIIGVDHGYRNMKTAHTIFKTAIEELSTKPDDLENVLEFNNHYYTISGEEVSSLDNKDKSNSKEFYLLTLVALAKELDFRKKTNVKAILCAGLPIAWYDSQKETFKKNLETTKNLVFSFSGKQYKISLDGVKIYKQGICAYLTNIKNNPSLDDFLLIDVGGGTFDIIPFEEGKPLHNQSKMLDNSMIYLYTVIKNYISTKFMTKITDKEITKIINEGEKKTSDPIVLEIHKILKSYCKKQLNEARQLQFNIDRGTLYFCGGGAMVFKNYSGLKENVYFNTDIHANAKGYEIMEYALNKKKK